MKRSENVGLMLMGGVALAATFAGGMAYMSMNRPSYAAQSCTAAQDGTQTCQQPASRGFTYYIHPGHWWGSSASASAKPQQQAALTSTSNPSRPATQVASGTERSGFGSSAKTSFRASAGG